MILKPILAALCFFTLLTAAAAQQSNGPLDGISTLRNAAAERSSSFDRQGGYIDAVPIKAGQSLTLLDTDGAVSALHSG